MKWKFPINRRERSGYVSSVKESTKRLRERGIEDAGWTQVDSKLIGGAGTYESTFSRIRFPGNISFKEYVEKALREAVAQNEGIVSIDLGGPGRNSAQSMCDLRDHRGDNFRIKKSLGITLDDMGYSGDDIEHHHTVFEEDLFDATVKDRVGNWLGEDRPHIVMCRMGGGVDYLPRDPVTLGKQLSAYYELLPEGGIMVVQTPVQMNKLLDLWKKLIDRDYLGLIEMFIDSGGYQDSNANLASGFVLRKLKGAPKTLPLLNPRDVGDVARYKPVEIPRNSKVS